MGTAGSEDLPWMVAMGKKNLRWSWQVPSLQCCGLVARFVALEMNVADGSMSASVILLTHPCVAKVRQTQCSYGKQNLCLRYLQVQPLKQSYGCLGAKMSSPLFAAKLPIAGSEEDAEWSSFSSQDLVP